MARCYLGTRDDRDGAGAELEQAQQKFDLETILKYCREELGFRA